MRHVVVISADPRFHQVVRNAMRELEASSDPAGPDVYAEVLRRARRHLGASSGAVTVISVRDFGEAAARLRDEEGTISLLVLDGVSGSPFDPGLEEEIGKLRVGLPAALRFEPSPYSVLAYCADLGDVALGSPYTLRLVPEESWVLAADVVCAFTDSVQVQSVSARFGKRLDAETTISGLLADFLRDQAGSEWGLHYYTGSAVARTIEELRVRALAGGNPVLSGPSEHSLACAALARWQLDAAPFLIVVTSGMVDEFRGTLSNLRAARAKGVIVCAESAPHQWMPFQGTVHSSEDSREVLRAKGIRCVYIADSAHIEEGFAELAEAYHADEGPVVLLATKDVLSYARPVAPPRHSGPAVVVTSPVDEIARVLNHEPIRVLCQPGPLTPAQSVVLQDIALEAGVALADSLAHPGVVSRYRDGERVEEYLGTLGLYGHSERVSRFLADEHALLFVDSPVTELDTPFNHRVLAHRTRVLQVVRDDRDVAPFAANAVTGDITALLTELRRRLAVDPEVLRMRRAAITATRDSFSDVIGAVPVRPMTANHFFRGLHDVLDHMITEIGYTYTGVYDVGRGGLSAICDLPRTGRGFSGWFGRALMGDALQSVPAVALTREDNVLAFIGDGAAALVPDIVPSLVQQVAVDGMPLRGNLSVFRLVNGGHSVIRTYREVQRTTDFSHQTSVLSFVEPDWRRCHGPLTVEHRVLDDLTGLAERLVTPGEVHLYSVPLSHNNEATGLSMLSARGWQRDERDAS